MTFAAHSQTSQTPLTDTTCLPNSQLRKALKLIEEGQQAKRENVILYKQIDIYERRIDNKDSLISILHEKYDLQVEIKKTYMRDVELYAAENRGLQVVILGLRKDVKKEKRKVVLWKVISLGIAAGAGYVLLK